MTRQHWLVLGVLSLLVCIVISGMVVMVLSMFADAQPSIQVSAVGAGVPTRTPRPIATWPATWTPVPSPVPTRTLIPTPTRMPCTVKTSKPATKPSTTPFNETADATKDLTAALAQSQADKKNLLVIFGANWCPYCRALIQSFEQEPVASFLDGCFHAIRIDVGEGKKNLDLSARFGYPNAGGIPAGVIVDSSGNVVVTLTDSNMGILQQSNSQGIVNFLSNWAWQ